MPSSQAVGETFEFDKPSPFRSCRKLGTKTEESLPIKKRAEFFKRVGVMEQIGRSVFEKLGIAKHRHERVKRVKSTKNNEVATVKVKKVKKPPECHKRCFGTDQILTTLY